MGNVSSQDTTTVADWTICRRLACTDGTDTSFSWAGNTCSGADKEVVSVLDPGQMDTPVGSVTFCDTTKGWLEVLVGLLSHPRLDRRLSTTGMRTEVHGRRQYPQGFHGAGGHGGLGGPVMKSTAMWEQGQLGTGRGCNWPARCWCDDLLRAQTEQAETKAWVSRDMEDHQKHWQMKPGWQESLEEFPHEACGISQNRAQIDG